MRAVLAAPSTLRCSIWSKSNAGTIAGPPAEQPKPNSVTAINFDVAMKIEGQESQLVTVKLLPGQAVRAEPGSLVYMTDGVEMDTNTGAGFMAGLKRLATSGTFFLTDFRYTKPSGTGVIALSAEYPSKIVRVSLEDYGGSIVCQKGAFLCGSTTVQVDLELVRSFTTGFFGGEGFVLQRLSGEGDAFVKAGGALIRRVLKDGEVMRASSGSIVAFAPTVTYDVQMIPGFKNVIFGSEGLFITTLTGPGTVFLQSLPFDRFVDQIARRIPSRSAGTGVMLGGAGAGGGGTPQGDPAPAGGGGEIAQNEDNLPGNPYDQDRAANVAGAAAMGSGTSEVFGKPFTAEENAATSATTGTSSHAGSSEEFKEEETWKEEPFDVTQETGGSSATGGGTRNVIKDILSWFGTSSDSGHDHGGGDDDDDGGDGDD